MPDQKLSATFQRRHLVLETVQRLSRTGRWVTQAEIVKDLKSQGYSVEKHHVWRDLTNLWKMHIQLERNDNSRGETAAKGLAYGYRWVGKDAPPETGMSIPEALSLVLVQRYLSTALPATLTQALDTWFDTAQKTLELHKKSPTTKWVDKIAVVPPAQPLLAPAIAPEVLNVVHEAVIKEEQIKVVYRSFGEEAKQLVLHPLGLIQRGPVSYLAAGTFHYDHVRLYALHRIISAESRHDPIRKQSNFDISKYADERGHFGTGKWITLKARVHPNLAARLRETSLGPDQSLSGKDEYAWSRLTVRVRDTWQLRWWLLDQGPQLEVTTPVKLRLAVIEALDEMQELYADLREPQHNGDRADA